MSNTYPHEPVLLEECLALLGPGAERGALVVDGTVGTGGHAEAILVRNGPDGRLIGLDRDADALRIARERLAPFGDRARLVNASFRELERVLAECGEPRVHAVLLDLGVSSLQLDVAARGFRFAEEDAAETPLDMRMDTSGGETAADLLRDTDEATLARWFAVYGELPGAHRLARAIVAERRVRPLQTAADLVRVVKGARVGGGRRHHPATLVFQALRIAVNDELGALDLVLDQASRALHPSGRLLVIAYHSLEDRAVKQRFAALERGCVCPPRLPVCVCGRKPLLRRITRRPVRPEERETRANPRARSARLRVAERLAEVA
ncbi:MAG TPA: 16S rRNA (cytosine(1402)-N(4))-methyltransferase RsmH [Myxococcota bacterium]|nr:16S rRNA (cytosine(1402)-N(4))-methyltransferase RsmH [Myxococcota bacterium]